MTLCHPLPIPPHNGLYTADSLQHTLLSSQHACFLSEPASASFFHPAPLVVFRDARLCAFRTALCHPFLRICRTNAHTPSIERLTGPLSRPIPNVS